MEIFLESLGVGLDGFLWASAFAFLGALVQGSIGFGLNLIVVPAIAVVRPEALPAAAIVLALPMTFGSAAREWRFADRAAIAWVTLGRLPGVAAGAWIVAALDAGAFSVLVGATVVAAALASLLSPRFEITPRAQAFAGFLGGVFGTTTSIGGPPLALLYQHAPGPVVRSTLGAAMLLGSVLSLGALALADEVGALHLRFGLAMIPPVLLGLLASRWLHAWLDQGWIRPAVLLLCTLSGLVVILDRLQRL